MSEQEHRTGEDLSNGTGADSASAIQNNTDSTATDQQPTSGQSSGENVTLSEKDYKNLVAQRDRANNAASENVSEMEGVYGMLGELAQREAMREIADKYPDVPQSVLKKADSYESMEELAKEFQDFAKKTKQEALKELSTVDGTPKLSDSDLAGELTNLKGSGKLEEAIGLKLFRRK